MLDLFGRFFQLHRETQLRLSNEILGGSWDALHTGRADLVVGACGDRPPGGGYSSYSLGFQQLVFAVSPHHPLAATEGLIDNQALKSHRVVAVADSSQVLKPRTVGILDGQEVLTVPDMRTKYEAQCMGLGVGVLPCYLARRGLDQGRLVLRQLEEPPPRIELWLAWRTGQKGNALQWFINELKRADLRPHASPAAAANEHFG